MRVFTSWNFTVRKQRSQCTAARETSQGGGGLKGEASELIFFALFKMYKEDGGTVNHCAHLLRDHIEITTKLYNNHP